MGGVSAPAGAGAERSQPATLCAPTNAAPGQGCKIPASTVGAPTHLHQPLSLLHLALGQAGGLQRLLGGLRRKEGRKKRKQR